MSSTSRTSMPARSCRALPAVTLPSIPPVLLYRRSGARRCIKSATDCAWLGGEHESGKGSKGTATDWIPQRLDNHCTNAMPILG
jgi:hypothetical protein